jgi:hypothetical protein
LVPGADPTIASYIQRHVENKIILFYFEKRTGRITTLAL